jgi:hypothetical protein
LWPAGRSRIVAAGAEGRGERLGDGPDDRPQVRFRDEVELDALDLWMIVV